MNYVTKTKSANSGYTTFKSIAGIRYPYPADDVDDATGDVDVAFTLGSDDGTV